MFANTTHNLADPEYPDFYAAKELLEKISEILGIAVDTSDLEEKGMAEGKITEEMQEQVQWQRREQEAEEPSGYV